MKIAEFKSAQNVDELEFYKSKTTARHIASNDVFMLVTTEDFDPKGECNVYRASAEQQADSELELYWLSNKAKAEGAFKL